MGLFWIEQIAQFLVKHKTEVTMIKLITTEQPKV